MSKGSREQRLANMQRPTARVNQILQTINETESQNKIVFDSIPQEVRPELANFTDRPTGNQYSLEDFYDYDYEDEMLPSMVDHIFNIVEGIKRSKDFLENYKEEALHNGELNPRENEEDAQVLNGINRAINDYENLIAETSHKHGLFVAMTKATDAPSRYDNFADVVNIVKEYRG